MRAIVMNTRAATAATRAEPLGEHADQRIERRAVDGAIRIGGPENREEGVFIPFFAGGGRDDLLGEDVERRLGHGNAVELAATDRFEEREHLDQLIA